MAQFDEIAEGREVLAFLSRVLRGENCSTAAMKAAELLGKRYALFAEIQEQEELPMIVDDIGAAQDQKEVGA